METNICWLPMLTVVDLKDNAGQEGSAVDVSGKSLCTTMRG